jgi:uncharacterized protein YecT (DUF1311 family)
MKQISWMVLGWLLLASAQAASFDCAKAKSKLEKIICKDAELSKLDEEMAALYGQIIKASSNDPVLKKTQQDWLKYRQLCLAPDYKQKESICLTYLYRRHIDILRGSLPTEPDAEKGINQLCTHIAVLVEMGKAFDLEPNDYEDNPPRGNDYKNLDIDGDGVADSVKTSCGSGECGLEVKLSSGKPYDLGSLDESYKFYLIRYLSSIYALVSYSEDEDSKDPKISTKYHLVRLYLLAPAGAKLVCGK